MLIAHGMTMGGSSSSNTQTIALSLSLSHTQNHPTSSQHYRVVLYKARKKKSCGGGGCLSPPFILPHVLQIHYICQPAEKNSSNIRSGVTNYASSITNVH